MCHANANGQCADGCERNDSVRQQIARRSSVSWHVRSNERQLHSALFEATAWQGRRIAGDRIDETIGYLSASASWCDALPRAVKADVGFRREVISH
jgi:hypothetical protein